MFGIFWNKFEREFGERGKKSGRKGGIKTCVCERKGIKGWG